MKLGGLLNELKNNIDELNNYNHHLEIKINKLENDNSQLNWEFDQSYYIPPGLANHYDYKKILEYRQVLLDRIANNNNINSTNLTTVVFNVAKQAIELKSVVSLGFNNFESASSQLESVVFGICDYKYKKLEDVVQAFNSVELSSNVKQDTFSINDFKSLLKGVSNALSAILKVQNIEMKNNTQKPIIQNNISIINDNSKNNINNNIQNRDQIIEKSQEKPDKDKVLDLIKAHELLEKITKATHTRGGKVGMYVGKMFNAAKTVGDLKGGLIGLKDSCVEKSVKNAVDEILNYIGSSNEKELLHDAIIYIDVEDKPVVKVVKLKRFAREKLKLVRGDVEEKLLSLSNEDIANLKLDKKYLSKLAEIKKSAQKRPEQSHGYLNSNNLYNASEKDERENNSRRSSDDSF